MRAGLAAIVLGVLPYTGAVSFFQTPCRTQLDNEGCSRGDRGRALIEAGLSSRQGSRRGRALIEAGLSSRQGSHRGRALIEAVGIVALEVAERASGRLNGRVRVV